MNDGKYFRDLTWGDLQVKLKGLREEVYRAWLDFGPGTTDSVCRKTDISILTFRPRTTELMQMGLIEVVGQDGHHGIYQAVSLEEWQARKGEMMTMMAQEQLMLRGCDGL